MSCTRFRVNPHSVVAFGQFGQTVEYLFMTKVVLGSSPVAVCNLFQDSPYPVVHLVTTSQLNLNKSQITGFHKMQNTRAGKPTTESGNKSQ